MSRPSLFAAAALLGRAPSAALVLLAGMTVAKLAYYMTWPFMAIVLNERVGLSLSEIGLIVTLAIVAGALAGPFAGYWGDRAGRRRVMGAGVGAVIAACLAIVAIDTAWIYPIALVAVGLSHSAIEPSLRARLGELCQAEPAVRDVVFHLRYYLVNLTAATGPLLSVVLGLDRTLALFLVVAAAYGLYGIAIMVATRPGRRPSDPSGTVMPDPSLTTVARAILSHRAFMSIFAANFLLIVVLALDEEPLTYHLLDLGVPDIAHIVAAITLTNVAVVLGIHLALLPRLMTLDVRHASVLAFAALTAAQLVIAVNPADLMVGWLVAVALASLAEVVALPIFNITVDRLAPPAMRGSFFGIATLFGLGGAVAPLLGGVMIDAVGGTAFFFLLAIACAPIGLACAVLLRRIGPPVPPSPR